MVGGGVEVEDNEAAGRWEGGGVARVPPSLNYNDNFAGHNLLYTEPLHS